MELLNDVELARFTSIRIGGKASYFAVPEDESELARVIELSRDKDLPLFILGGGSNTVFGNLRGFVVSLSRIRGMSVSFEGDLCFLKVRAGTPLRDVVLFALKENLEGIYRLAGFPASVGGAVAMNAGAFGVEMGDFVEEVSFVNWSGELVSLPRERLSFSYRSSPFPSLGVVVSCTLRLKRSRKLVLEDYRMVRSRRRGAQPVSVPTSGSTFKNPLPLRAGALLERVGLKGYRVGNVSFSEKHANFMVNLGGGSFKEVLSLIREARRRVFEEFGVRLEEEVKLVEDSGLDGWKVL